MHFVIEFVKKPRLNRAFGLLITSSKLSKARSPGLGPLEAHHGRRDDLCLAVAAGPHGWVFFAGNEVEEVVEADPTVEVKIQRRQQLIRHLKKMKEILFVFSK